MAEVARYIGKAKPAELGDICVWLGRQYGEAFGVPERNEPGNVTCFKIQQLRYPRTYHRDVPDRFSDHNNSDDDFYVGFHTTQQTKSHIIYQIGVPNLRDRAIIIRHPEAIRQWTIYENNDGIAGAPAGEKDDCVMADLLAAFGHFQPGVAPFIQQSEVELILEEMLKLDPKAAMLADLHKKIRERTEQYWAKSKAEERAMSRRSRRRGAGSGW